MKVNEIHLVQYDQDIIDLMLKNSIPLRLALSDQELRALHQAARKEDPNNNYTYEEFCLEVGIQPQ